MNKMESHKEDGALYPAVIAIAFIAAGFLILGRNMGWIDSSVANFFLSWEMILIVVGIVCLVKRQLTGGFILIALGLYFLISHSYHLHLFWPTILIIVGVCILFRAKDKGGKWPFAHRQYGSDGERSYTSRDNLHEETTGEAFGSGEGFVNSDVTFSSARHIVLEPVFKGADLDVTFGALIIDLRRTRLEMPQTVIQLDATFSSVELYVPSSWNVLVETEAILSGFKDKRFLSQPVDTGHKLILRGNVTFSSVDIKN